MHRMYSIRRSDNTIICVSGKYITELNKLVNQDITSLAE